MSYHRHRQERAGKNWRIAIICFAVAAVVVAGLFMWHLHKQDTADYLAPEQSASDVAVMAPKFTQLKAEYIFSGTIVLGRAVERDARNADGSYDYNQPFSKLNTLRFDAYDAGIIDMECPSTGRRVSFEESVNNLIFDCHPEWFPTLGKYFQVMNVAGNHTYDAGPEGFTKTVQNIQKAGLQAAGHYDPRQKSDICEVVGLQARLQKTGGGEQKTVLPLAICTFHYQFHLSPQPGEIETIKEYAKYMPVVGMMHSGVEYTAQATAQQQQIARAMIDNGASFVIGNGAHWVQNTEVYNGKLIVYSTGNFIFDQLGYDERLGLSIGVEVTVPYNEALAAWLKLGESCNVKARDDTCLQAAVDQNSAPIRPTFTFEAVGSYGGAGRVTERATASQQKDIETRANWSQTLDRLGQ